MEELIKLKAEFDADVARIANEIEKSREELQKAFNEIFPDEN